MSFFRRKNLSLDKPVCPVEIDYEHQLSKGLRTAFIFQSLVELVESQVEYNSSVPNKVSGNAHVTGDKKLDLNGNGTDCLILGNTPRHSGVITIVARVMHRASQNNMILGEDYSSGARRNYQFRINASNKIEFIPFNSSGSLIILSGSATLQQNKFNTVACVYDDSGTGNARVYVEGELDATGSLSGGLAGTYAYQGVGCRVNDLVGNAVDTILDGQIEFLYQFDRVLSDAEIKSLSSNPYQILKPQAPDYFWLPDAVAGGLSVSLSASGLLTASAGVKKPAVVNLSGSAGLDVNTAVTKPVSVALSGVGSFSAFALQVYRSLIGFGALSSLSVTAVVKKPVAVNLSGVAGLVVASSNVKQSSILLSAVGGLVSTAVVRKPVLVALTGTGSLSVAVGGKTQAAVNLVAVSNLTTQARVTQRAFVALSAQSSLLALPAVKKRGSVNFLGSGLLLFLARQRYVADVGLFGESSLVIGSPVGLGFIDGPSIWSVTTQSGVYSLTPNLSIH